MRAKGTIFLLATLFLAASCSTITQQEAEASALQFVKNNVKFFAKEKNSTVDLPKYKITDVKSYEEGNGWMVVVKVSADLGDDTKDNDLAVKVDNSGKVVEFNGRKVP